MHEGPIGRTFTVLGKSYLHILHQKLGDLDIDRYYHTLMFIDEGNGVITQKYALGCIPTANFGENVIISGTPAGVRRPQSLYK